MTTIYGYEGSYAETYAKEQNITFTPLKEERLTDTNTGIIFEGVIAPDYQFTVKKDVASEETDSITYKISLVNAAAKNVQPYEDITINIPVPEELEGAENYYVFYKDGDKLTEIESEHDKESNSVAFTTDHFSTYILSTVDLTDPGEAGTTTTAAPAPVPGGNIVTPNQPTTTTETTTTESAVTEPTVTEPTVTEPATTTTPAATTAAPTTSATTNEDASPNTGVTLLILPALAAVSAVIITKKRR